MYIKNQQFKIDIRFSQTQSMNLCLFKYRLLYIPYAPSYLNMALMLTFATLTREWLMDYGTTRYLPFLWQRSALLMPFTPWLKHTGWLPTRHGVVAREGVREYSILVITQSSWLSLLSVRRGSFSLFRHATITSCSGAVLSFSVFLPNLLNTSKQQVVFARASRRGIPLLTFN